MTHPERRSITLDGHAHGSLPIPAASRVGNMIATAAYAVSIARPACCRTTPRPRPSTCSTISSR